MTNLTKLTKWVDKPDYLNAVESITNIEAQLKKKTQELEGVNAELKKTESRKRFPASLKKILLTNQDNLSSSIEDMQTYLAELQKSSEYLKLIDANGMVKIEDLHKVNILDVNKVLVQVIPTLPMRGDLVSEFRGTLEGSKYGISPYLNIQKYEHLIENAFHPHALDYELVSEVGIETIESIVSEEDLDKRAALVKSGELKPLTIIPKKVAVNVLIDSKGGSPTESCNIAKKLLRESKKHNIPFNTFTNNGAYSGGMFILCIGQQAFVANPFTSAGSIGVVGGYCQLTDQGRKKAKVRHHIVQAGDKKRTSLSDFHAETTEEDEADYQKRLAEAHELFKDFVRMHRPENSLKGDEAEIFSGDSFSAKRALELGLIDGILDHEEFVEAEYGDRAFTYVMRVTDDALSASAALESITGDDGDVEVRAGELETDGLDSRQAGFQVQMRHVSRFSPILAKK